MSSLDSDGLSIDRLPEILESIENDEKSLVDPLLSFTSDSLLGHLNNIMAERFSSLNYLAQAVYDAFNVKTAEGKNLDDLAYLRGISRIGASYSSTYSQLFVGESGITIPANSIFTNPYSGDTFTNPSSITLDTSSCYSATLEVMDVLDNTEYEITINGDVYSYTSSGSATATEIADGLATQVTTSDYTATSSDGNITVTSATPDEVTISTVTYIQAVSVETFGYIRATETGPIIAPENSITEITTIISGLTSTTNTEAVVLGRDEETDEELRERITLYGSANGTGTIPSIEAAIFNNVDGVSSVSITENAEGSYNMDLENVTGTFVTGETIEGATSGGSGLIADISDSDQLRVVLCGLEFEEGEVITGVSSGATATIEKSVPPHSYETVVVGGDDTEVAEELWLTKPAGIKTYGNTSVVVQDSNGNNRAVSFTRPTPVNFAIRVTYSLYIEETTPVDREGAMGEAIEEFVNSLGIDVDMIPGRLYAPIYGSTTGLGDITVEVQKISSPGDTPDSGSWQSTTVPVENSEYASTTSVDIYFVEV